MDHAVQHHDTEAWDQVWTGANIATMVEGGNPYGAMSDAAVAVRGERIAWIGPARQALPQAKASGARVHDAAGLWITPGLVDCHTHLVYGGDRAEEFELRLAGASYEELSKRGGGIASTVKATRLATEDQLVASALLRLDALIAEGVTTIEIKSGYGLDLATESRQLQIGRRLARERPIDVHTSFLGAHAMPPEAKGDTSAYIDAVCAMLPPIAAEGLADSVDAFCDNIGFSHEETTRVFEVAKKLKLPMRLHADQLANLHGAALAAKYGALSADHLERADGAGIVAMKAAGTVAVILPGAYYFIRETQLPPIDAMRRHGVPIAISTDCNPGSSPLTSLLLTMNMGATLFRLTVEECLAGVTREAARALGRLDTIGTLEAS